MAEPTDDGYRPVVLIALLRLVRYFGSSFLARKWGGHEGLGRWRG